MEFYTAIPAQALLSANMVNASAAAKSVDAFFPIESIKERLQAMSSDCCSSNNYDTP